VSFGASVPDIDRRQVLDCPIELYPVSGIGAFARVVGRTRCFMQATYRLACALYTGELAVSQNLLLYNLLESAQQMFTVQAVNTSPLR